LEEAFDPLLTGPEQFKLQHSRAIDTVGASLADCAFLQQSGMLAIEPSPSCACTPVAPPTRAITKMNDVSHFRILNRTVLTAFSNCQGVSAELTGVSTDTLRHYERKRRAGVSAA